MPSSPPPPLTLLIPGCRHKPQLFVLLFLHVADMYLSVLLSPLPSPPAAAADAATADNRRRACVLIVSMDVILSSWRSVDLMLDILLDQRAAHGSVHLSLLEPG